MNHKIYVAGFPVERALTYLPIRPGKTSKCVRLLYIFWVAKNIHLRFVIFAYTNIKSEHMYSVPQANPDSPKNMLLLKDPQFLPNH